MISVFDRLYRILFCRGGHGVHSPFAFDLITTVIEEKRMYYCYEMLDNIRLQLKQESQNVKVGNSYLTIRKALRTSCFSVEGSRLLFRLANHFRPEKILIIGSGLGLTPLYVTAYSKKTDCIVFEPESSMAVIAHNVVKKYSHSPIRIYDKISDEFNMSELEYIDFIVWGNTLSGTFMDEVSGMQHQFFPVDFSSCSFENILGYVSDRSILVIYGINSSSANKKTWDELCLHPKVSVTFDFYTFGLVFFNPKLHRKTYKSLPV